MSRFLIRCSYVIFILFFAGSLFVSEKRAKKMSSFRFCPPFTHCSVELLKEQCQVYFFKKTFPKDKDQGSTFIFGSNALGQDVFLMSLYAFRCGVLIACIATILTLFFAIILALLSLLIPSFKSILWIGGNFVQAIPLLFVLIALSSLKMNGMTGFANIVLIVFIPFVGAIPLARYLVTRLQSIWESTPLLSARKASWSTLKLSYYGLFPSLKGYLQSYLGLLAVQYTLLDALLGFIGLSLFEGASLGHLLSQAQNVYIIIHYGWIFIVPASFLFFLLVNFQLLCIERKDDLKYE